MTTELSPREVQVISMYAYGITGPEIGKRLGISKYTVHTHLQRITRKLRANNRVHAAVVFSLRARA